MVLCQVEGNGMGVLVGKHESMAKLMRSLGRGSKHTLWSMLATNSLKVGLKINHKVGSCRCN